MKRLSFSSLMDRFGKSWARFPLVHAMLSLLVFVLICQTLSPKLLSENWFLGTLLFAQAGFPIALACALLRETGVLKRGILADAVVLAAWLGAVVWICCHRGIPAVYLAVSVNVLAVATALTAPFLKDRDDERLFRGTCDILRDGFSAGIVAGVLLAGVELLIVIVIGADMLLGGSDLDSIATIAAILAGLGVFGVLFLVRLPEPWPSEEGLSKFTRGAVRYLFLPLLGLYLLTLYVYAGKILFNWKLPDGTVSWLVSVSMALMLVVAFALNPQARDEKPGALRTVVRLLPWLVLPLLALMTVGIVRRVRDYGWTVDRVYLALFNLWCYGVCIYLILNGCRKLRWVPMSFALLLFLSSVGPWSVSSSVRRTLQKEVRSLLGNMPLPVTLQDIQTLDSDASGKVKDKLDYLEDTFGKESVEAYFVETSLPDESVTDVSSIRKQSGIEGLAMDIPAGYRRVRPEYHSSLKLVSMSEDSFRIELVRDGVPLRFDLPVSGLKMPMTVHECEGRAILRLSEITVYEYPVSRMKAGQLPDPTRNDGMLVGLLFLK